MNETTATITAVLFLILVIVAIILGLMFGVPLYRVWAAEKHGMAELRRAEQNKQIRVEEARAQFEGAKLLAQAEVERARGVAEANEIIGESLKGNEVYLRYLWVQNLAEGANKVIYVPTEANLPLLEAGRAPLSEGGR